MKRILAVIFGIVLTFGGVACAKRTVRFDGEKIAKISIFSGGRGDSVHLDEGDEALALLTENIGALSFKKDKSAVGYGGFRYSMKWYGADGVLIEGFTIMNETRIRYDDYFYDVENGEIDLALVERLFNPYYQKPTGSELDFWITQDLSSVDLSAYRSKPDFMGATKYIPNRYEEGAREYVSYLVGAYPDYADGGAFITGITITDRSVKVLGDLTIASTVEEWDGTLTALRFERVEVEKVLDEGTEYKELWKSRDNKLTITLLKRGEGYALYITAYVSNRENLT